MFKLLNTKLLLSLIVIVAAFLRLYNLGIVPASLTWDEAAWGYNAYSIGIDGKDEFGKFLPLDYLESFGDFKPPVYAYLTVLPVKIFGLTEFATRFSSAFFGILTVLISYFLILRIFYFSEKKESIALSGSFFLAVSPWHVMLSRAAFEANVATFFIVCGVWLFLAGIQEKKWCLLLSATSFVLSIYTFNTARIVSPLLVLVLTIGFRKELIQRKREIIISLIVGLLLFMPIAKFLLSPQASLRFKEVNIFSDPSIVKQANQEITNDKNVWWSKLIHNRRFIYATVFLRHYFDNLNPGFLFIKGDGNPKFSTQDVGELYFWDFPFFVFGLFLLFKNKEGYWWIIPLWLTLGIIPAATARETPHALRIETTLPTFQMVTAYGFIYIISKFKKQIPIIAIIFILLGINVIYFQHGYYVHYTREYSGEWQYGYKDSINYVKAENEKFDKIWITDVLGRPYIYYLFYNKVSPQVFRQTVNIKRDGFGFVHVLSFGKYHFSDKLPLQKKSVLYINTLNRVPAKANLIKAFYLLNGELVLQAYIL